jgi:Bacteriocin-protection, YdeI or OmpD-Associated
MEARDRDRSHLARRFVVTVSDGGRGRIFVPVPFDPDSEWGPKPRHPVGGTLNGNRVRAVVQLHDGAQGFVVGPAWLRGCDLSPGDRAEAYLEPEGPQRQDLADDIAAALEANPGAAQFFDGLAQFYRRGYLRWIDATKRSPERRQQRIATMVRLLEAGIKDYHDQ